MSDAVPLSRLAVGAKAEVVDLTGDAVQSQRLMELGLLPGVKLTLVRVAPLGDPVEIHLLGYRLSLRKADAAAVLVRA